MWFFDFVTSLIGYFEGDRLMKCSDCAKKAYDEALAPHHPLPIRIAAKAALNFTPSREKFLKGLFPEEMSEEERYHHFRHCLDIVGPVRKFLWKYYEEHGIKEIP